MKQFTGLMVILFLMVVVPFVQAEVTQNGVPFEELSPRDALELFSQQINPVKSMTETITGAFSFVDQNEHYGIRVAFGEAEFIDGKPPMPDFSITIRDAMWQRVVHGEISIFDAITSDDPDVSMLGSSVTFLKFMGMFDKTPDTKVRRH